MAFVEKDQIGKIGGQGLQPAVFGAALELTDIRDGDVRVL
jgi:hypothetical protein